MAVWLKRVAWVVGVVLVLGLLAWLGVPALIKWQAPPRLSALLGRTVTLADVGFKPWALTLTVDGLAISGPASGDAPLLKVRHLLVDASASSLFRLAPVIEAIEINGPELRVARTSAGHYDIDDLIARFTPATPPDAKPSEPARFALYNLQVSDGLLSFDDRPLKQVQKIEGLKLSLPFISNLPAQVDIKVEPKLAFKLNGTAFDSGALATPFAKTRSGVLKLAMTDMDLAPYLGYLPASLPVRVLRGSVSADIGLSFAVPASGLPNFTLSGTAGVKNLALSDAAGAPLLDWQRLQLGLRDVQPLARKLAFDSLRVDGLQVHAVRDAAGHINLLGLAGPAEPVPTVAEVAASAASAAASAASAASTASASAAPGAWQVTLDTLSLADARVLWNDAAVQPAAALAVDGMSLDAKKIQWPIAQPIVLTLNGSLHSQAAGSATAPAAASFTVDGPVTDTEARLKLAFKGLSLASFAPYAAQSRLPAIDGRLSAQAELDWSGKAEAPRLKVALADGTLDDLTVREGGGKVAAQDALTWKQLALVDAQIDVLARTAVLGSVKLTQPNVVVAREADGQLNLQHWAVTAAPAVAAKTAVVAASGAAAASGTSNDAWRVQLKDLLLDGGTATFSDAKVGKPKAPMRVEVGALHLAVQGFEWHGDQAMPASNVQLSARVGSTAAQTQDHTKLQKPRDGPHVAIGTIDYKGRVGLTPLLATGKLMVSRFPVQLFAPYFADQVKLSLLNAEVGYKGDVAVRQLPAGLDVSTSGDVLLGGVHVATLPDPRAVASATTTDELLSWQSLQLNGVKFAMKPKVKPRLEIAEAALTDFYSRLVITEQGSFNLRDVGGAPAPGDAASAGSSSAGVSAPDAASLAASAVAPLAVSLPASAASAPAVADSTPLPIDIKVGVTRLINGRIDYSDHFVRPNYSAALTELNGSLGAFSSTSPDTAALELHGRAEGTAILDIKGKLNPLARPLALDIQAKATDLELAPLSPYAGKYAGYAIERGKLSMDVAYKIDPDGKLDASNQVVLNQLTFGDKIESKDATKLPVLLAVALMKDRNGVIDINLPVSGSLNDPNFSIGGIIFKLIVNLLVKALTSPFSLLSGGGGSDLSVVEFQPGTAQFTAEGASAVDKVAKALVDRPALKMTVTGASDPVSERDAFQHAAIEARLVAEARRESLRAGTAPAAPASAATGAAAAASAPVVLSVAEHLRLLTKLYKDTDIPNKPRNAIGFATEIPPAEMEALLKTRTPVDDDAMRALALQRGLAVRDAVLAKGLPSERVFLAAPKLRAAAENGTAWTPRVQLSLTPN